MSKPIAIPNDEIFGGRVCVGKPEHDYTNVERDYVNVWQDDRGSWYGRRWADWGEPSFPKHGPFGTEDQAKKAALK